MYFLCVCLSTCNRSCMSKHTRVCMSSPVTVCVHTWVYLYKDIGGVLDLWGHSSNGETLPFPSTHSGCCRGLPLKLNERSLNNSSRQVNSLFKHSTSAPFFFHSFLLSSTYVTFVTKCSSFSLNPSPPPTGACSERL